MTTFNEVWRYQGGFYPSNSFVFGVAAADDNSVFLLGSQDDFGTSGSDFAAVKLDADGDFLWDWTEESEGDDFLFSAAAVADGVVGSGNVNGTWNGELSLGGADFAAVKLYSNGIVAWRWKEGTSSDDFLFAAVEAADGNVVVAGNTQGSWSEINDGWYDVAVAKLNVDDGEVIWRYQSGTTEDAGAYGRAAAVRGDGSVVVGGHTFGSFAADFVGESGATDFIAVALDEDGNELWRWQGGPGTGFNSIYGIAVFDDDSILLAGLTEGSWAIDNLGETDFALAKLSASGDLVWSWQEGTALEEEFAAAAIGIDGSAILSGYTYGSWDGTQAGTDIDRDFVAMSINAEGDVLWRYQAGGTSSEDYNDVAVRADGSIVLGGWTNGIWTTPETSDSWADFAAVLLTTTTSTTTSATFPTPSPVLPETKTSSRSDSETPFVIAIVGSIGGAAVVAILIACCFCWWCRGQDSQTTPSPAPQAPIVVGRLQNTVGANGSANVPLPAYTKSPPIYTDPPPAYTQPLPAYSSVA